MRDADPKSEADPAVGFPGELMIWLSASFPVGGFAYSQGLETAVARNWVVDRATLADWLRSMPNHGSLRNDLILISLIMSHTNSQRIDELVDLAVMLQPCAERHAEAVQQGRSFVDAYEAAWCETEQSPFDSIDTLTLPSALAIVARRRAIPLSATLEAYALTFLTNLISAAIRLSVVGQFDGQRIIADLLVDVRRACGQALRSSEDDLGSATYGADLAAMLHETQTTRLFRS